MWISLFIQQHGLAGVPLFRNLAFRQITCKEPRQGWQWILRIINYCVPRSEHGASQEDWNQKVKRNGSITLLNKAEIYTHKMCDVKRAIMPKLAQEERLRNFEEEVEAFCTDLKKFYREDHVYKGTAGDFNADWPQKNTWRTSHRNLRPSME
ncbi:hypothetical protein RB195_025023 [Necator americanus]|uniref:Uncharacterized protein n=1 Tax=Necator americanus TaxID=51031 RepID=A0ABR1ESR1_NECAM